MACRCEDLVKMKNDLGVLTDAYGKVTRLKYYDAEVAGYLEGISSVIDSTLMVPQNGLPGQIKGQNQDANTAISALDTAITDIQNKLLEEIEAAEAEDAAAH